MRKISFRKPKRKMDIEVAYKAYHEPGESNDNLLLVPKQEYFTQIKPNKKLNSQSRNFACKFCNRKFAQKIHLDGHYLNKHKDIPDAQYFVSSKIHYCKYCDYRTINSHNLASHKSTKHKQQCDSMKTLYCLHCNYTTRNKGNFVIHSRRHADIKLFHCQYCEKSYNQKGNLDTHYLRKHRGEAQMESLITSKVYKCEHCDFGTVSKTKYSNHSSNCCTKGFFKPEFS